MLYYDDWYRHGVPLEMFDGEIELTTPNLLAGEPDGVSGFPRLLLGEGTTTRSFPALYLETEVFRAGFVPALGGRLLELVDKVTGTVVISSALEFRESEPRGVHGFGGFEWTLDEKPRLNGLGPVAVQASEETLCLAEPVAGNGLAYHLFVSAEAPGRLDFEWRIRNRTLAPQPWNPGFLGVGYDPNRDAGVALVGASAQRFSKQRMLAPRWGDTMRFSLIPYSGIGPAVAASHHALLAMTEEGLTIRAMHEAPGAKLVLKTSTGQTMEAPVDLNPERLLTYTFAELGGKPEGFVILDADRAELLRWPSPEIPSEEPRINVSYAEAYGDPATLELEPATRYWAAHLRTQTALQKGDWEEAAKQAETALLYNGEDPFAWIEKAVALRRLAGNEDESPELPNAHYLAPTEPLLRTESYLAQPGLDARTFFAAMADAPHDLLEAISAYLDWGLTEDAVRLIDAGLAVTDLPLLRYLYAACCLRQGTMAADAAAAVRAVTQVQPPYPWRPAERAALQELLAAFPNEPVLARYCGMVNLVGT